MGCRLKLINRRNMLPYLLRVASVVVTLWLQTVEAIIASQVLDHLTLVSKSGLMLFQLMGSPKAVAAQELDRCTQCITRESVWLCS